MESISKNELMTQTEALLSHIDLKSIFAKLMRHKWIIVSVTALAFLAGGLYVATIKPKYVSNALIQVDNQLGSANNIQQMLGNVGSTFSTVERASPAEIEIALIQSRFILQSVIDKFHLDIQTRPRYFPILGAIFAKRYQGESPAHAWFGLSQFSWGGDQINIEQFAIDSPLTGRNFELVVNNHGNYSLYSPSGEPLLQGKVGQPAKSHGTDNPGIRLLLTKLNANPGTHYSIALRHSDEVLKDLVQNLSITDLGYKNKTKTGILQLSYNGTNPQLIADILNTIVDFAIQKNVEKKSAEASKTLEFLGKQLPHVRRSLEKAEKKLNDYRTQSGTIDITEEAKVLLTQLSTLEESIAKVKLQKVELLQELTEKHPFIIAVDEKAKQLQQQALDLEIKIRALPDTDQKALSLERDVKVKNQLYLLLLNNIQQLQVLEAGTLSDIRILTPASVPMVPIPPHKAFTLLCITLAGLFIALMLIFIMELLQNKATDHELIEEKLGISTFAIIPYSAKQKQLARKVKANLSLDTGHTLAQSAPKDVAIEAIRSLRTMLQFSLEQASNNIISILGASPSIGKSFVSINLAQVLAECGKRVVLIDADMRKGKLNQQLAQKKIPGLSEVLANKCPLEAVINTNLNSFDFISSGAYPTHPSELLLTDALSQCLSQLSKKYDLVLLDTPPILAVTDGIIIAKFCSTNLMVIGAEVDKIVELELMVKRVKKNDIAIHGFVLNNTHRENRAYGQFNYYYDYDNVTRIKNA